MILALAVGFFLGWTGKLWVSRDKISNQNQLGRIAAAMHNYASTTDDGGKLPAGNWSATGVPGTGPFAAILPFLEQLWTIPADTTVAWYVNSADATNRRHTPGLTSYTYNSGWLGRPTDVLPLKKVPNLNRMVDGTVNTILLTEQLMNCGGTPNPWHANRGLDGVQFDDSGRVTFAAPPRASNLGPGATCTPNAPSGSYAGLILVAMGDASVRSVATGIASSKSGTPNTSTNWQKAVTPDSNDILGSDW